MCTDSHVHERASEEEKERERESVFHHPVNSSRSELSYPPPTRERERGSHATAKRGEESARRRESEEKKRASLDPLAGNFLSALGRGKQVGKSVHLFLAHLLAWTFFCFSPLSRGEFWGREGIWRGRMVNNLIECEEAEGAANSQGEWRNLSRSHTPTHAATGMVSADGGRVRAAGSAVAAHDRSTPVLLHGCCEWNSNKLF